MSAKDNVGSPFAFLTRIALLVAFTVLQVGFNIFILTVKIDESIKGAKAFIAFAAAFCYNNIRPEKYSSQNAFLCSLPKL